MECVNLLTDPIGPDPPDSPPRPPRVNPTRSQLPSSPESFSSPVFLFAWAKKKVNDFRSGMCVLLANFGFSRKENIDRFKDLEKSAGAGIDNDAWIDKLEPTREFRKGRRNSGGSTSRQSTPLGENSGLKCSTSSTVDMASEASTSAGTSSGGSRSQLVREESSGSSTNSGDPCAIRDFVVGIDSLLKEINEFCQKYFSHQVSIEMQSTVRELNRKFALKRDRKLIASKGRLYIKKYMPLLWGIKELDFVVTKIIKNQKLLMSKICFILRRKNRLDQFFRDGNLSLLERKDNHVSYSLFWIDRHFFYIHRIMEKTRKFHVVFELVRKKVEKQLKDF